MFNQPLEDQSGPNYPGPQYTLIKHNTDMKHSHIYIGSVLISSTVKKSELLCEEVIFHSPS